MTAQTLGEHKDAIERLEGLLKKLGEFEAANKDAISDVTDLEEGEELFESATNRINAALKWYRDSVDCWGVRDHD